MFINCFYFSEVVGGLDITMNPSVVDNDFGQIIANVWVPG